MEMMLKSLHQIMDPGYYVRDEEMDKYLNMMNAIAHHSFIIIFQ